ncbi:MAG: sigma factor-like helix-turn-helix DNA-binding protein, partial [Solirubrobacteraceae bacterium]
ELWLEATELLRAVAQLPARQRQVIELTAAGFTHRETAERIGGTARGVENSVRLARRKLRGQLAA